MSTEIPTPVEEQTDQAVPTIYVIIGIAVVIIFSLAIIIGTLYVASTYPAQLEAIRDVFIIALALESCIFGVVLMLMLIMLIRLVNTVEFEIKPILQQTNETIGTVRGTTNFVSKNVVQPAVKVGGYISGTRRGLKVLFGDPRKNLPD